MCTTSFYSCSWSEPWPLYPRISYEPLLIVVTWCSDSLLLVHKKGVLKVAHVENSKCNATFAATYQLNLRVDLTCAPTPPLDSLKETVAIYTSREGCLNISNTTKILWYQGRETPYFMSPILKFRKGGWKLGVLRPLVRVHRVTIASPNLQFTFHIHALMQFLPWEGNLKLYEHLLHGVYSLLCSCLFQVKPHYLHFKFWFPTNSSTI